MGDMSHDADEWAFARAGKKELGKLMYGDKRAMVFTKEEFPNEPNYLLYQNTLMASGMTPEARQSQARERYKAAKEARVGEEFKCPGCNATVTKGSYQQTFCKEKIPGRSTCKDFFNNWERFED